MAAGELRHQIQLEALSYSGASNNGDYAAESGWGIVANVWGSITYSRGREDSGDRDSTQNRAVIKIRWRDDVSNRMRVSSDGHVFDIEDNYDPTGRKRYLLLHVFIVDATPANEAIPSEQLDPLFQSDEW